MCVCRCLLCNHCPSSNYGCIACIHTHTGACPPRVPTHECYTHCRRCRPPCYECALLLKIVHIARSKPHFGQPPPLCILLTSSTYPPPPPTIITITTSCPCPQNSLSSRTIWPLTLRMHLVSRPAGNRKLAPRCSLLYPRHIPMHPWIPPSVPLPVSFPVPVPVPIPIPTPIS